MEDQFFLNAEIPPPSPPLHFEVEPLSAWYSLSELNYSQDCFLTPYWDISADYGLQFDSALSSMASSPATSNSPFQDMPELVSFHEEPAVSVLNPNAGPGSKASNSRKRKAETSATPARIGRKMSDKNSVTKEYIHVRARRGEATDSHSLAERVRREKISERMKILQNLVPGCSKVIGKALVLDEIINYVRSLQSQVEFLSMELASVRIGTDFNADSMFHHSLAHPTDSSASAIFGQQNPELYSEVSNGTMVLV